MPFRPKQKPLPIAQQRLALEKYCETRSVRSSGGHHLYWEGWVQPSPYMRRFLISTTLILKGCRKVHPKVYLLEPEIDTRDGAKCEHLYPEDDSLCLYYPFGSEWGPHMLLAKTVVPWASRWLYFYEIWLDTGIWFGGGIHPTGTA